MKAADEIFEIIWAVLMFVEMLLRMFGRLLFVVSRSYDWDEPIWKVVTVLLIVGLLVLIGCVIVGRRRARAAKLSVPDQEQT